MSKVSEQTSASTLTGTETLYVVQGGNSRKAIVSSLIDASQFSQSATYSSGTIGEKLQQIVSVKDQPFGAVGDGVTDDTAAWLAFKSYCVSSGSAGYMPSGTYLIDAFSFQNHSGLKLYGASNNPNFSQVAGTPQTVLKLRSAGSTFVTINGVFDLDIQNIYFDGGQFADTVLDFPGTSGVTDNTFTRCSFDGATPTTGVTFNFHGTLQVDNTRFVYCNVGQILGGNGATLASSLITNTNSNAFNISFEHCRFQDAIDMFVFGAGSCSFYRCDYFNASTTIFKITSVTQGFSIIKPYTEACPGVPFFKQTGSVGVSNGIPITIGIAAQLNSTNDILLNCQQPVRLIGVSTAGNIDVTPLATYGVFYVLADNVNFGAGKGWTGTGYPSKVISLNEVQNLVPQGPTIGPGLANDLNIATSTDATLLLQGVNVVSRNSGTGLVTLYGGSVGSGVVCTPTFKPASAGGFLSSDSSAGISTTITTGSLVGKTITVKDGLITGFA